MVFKMRRFLEPAWVRGHEASARTDGEAIADIPSRFTCGRTSLFVCRVLQRKGYDAGWIIDITADQFAAPAVIVAPEDDPRYGKQLRDTALPRFVAAREQAVLDIWPEWLAFEHAETCTSGTSPATPPGIRDIAADRR
jgi:hypothetical protein